MDYSNYLLKKYGTVEDAMQAVKTDAELALQDNNLEDFKTSTEAFQQLEVLKAS
ncbi:MAG: hypothetical protein GY775_14610 [Candidatus Scalindua sp.]|nr:hypothetical protein [Candidatus Scalindua sp.]